MGLEELRLIVKPTVPVLLIYTALLTIRVGAPLMEQFTALLIFYIALGQAFNIFLGMTGYVDFGYVAFLALGAYGMALAVEGLAASGSSGPLAVVSGLALGGAMATLLALVVGAIALRLRGAYFAIATIGVNEGFRFLIEGTGIWGGSEGIIIAKELRELFGREAANLMSTVVADYVTFGIALSATLTTAWLIHSRAGYALKALREDEDAAKVMGVNTVKYKIMAFVLSASLAGFIGASAWALKTLNIFPEDVFLITYTVEAIVIVMLGGAGTILGPALGGVIYGFLKYYLTTLIPGLQLLILAPILIGVILFFPEGVVGWVRAHLKHQKLKDYFM